MSAEHHEAGHALAAVLLGLPLKYVTVVPDDRSGGHATCAPPDRWWNTPAWVNVGVFIAAGMAAEGTEWARYPSGGPDCVDYIRSVVAEGGGTGSQPIYDTATLRWIARTAWTTARDHGAHLLGSEFDPAWADTPDGVRHAAAHCWRKAITLMCQHAGAITRIGRALKKHRTLTGAQVAQLVTRRPARRTIDPDLVGTDFWLTDYSRLVWRPHGMCNPAAAAGRK